MIHTEILIVGAGPGGCAAAIALARAGVQTLLVDRQDFPRDKVCGDGLIPDALNALETLGLLDTIGGEALSSDIIRVHAPNGNAIHVEGRFACLPRRELDHRLLQAALEAGVGWMAPARLTDPLLEDGRVIGARLIGPDGRAVEVRADITLLATGAAVEPLRRFGVCQRQTPSAMAARAYYRVPPALATEYDGLSLSYTAAICPGYGWIFPGPQGIYNLGVGIVYGQLHSTVNLRQLWHLFLEEFAPARRLVQSSKLLGPLKGAPMRTGMTGARLWRPGLLVIGEAAGLTFPATGEGIGKALESGLLAAEVLTESSHDGQSAGARYEQRLRERFAARYRSYQRAERFLAYPWIINLLTWRANRGQYIRREMGNLLTETCPPGAVFSPLGIARTLLF
ncbi:MAG: geranylgeranyl reductase family protein [Candidatus Competibacteraceae bacterium]|nr:geranylgeranyl reductase family protein [Candidatus Competibacteraceae bacterium]